MNHNHAMMIHYGKYNKQVHIQMYTYLLIPWSRVLLEKLTGLQLVKRFPASYGTRRFTIAFTSARHLSLSWASSIQSIPPHPTSWRSILILSSHLRLGLSSCLVQSSFPTKSPYAPLLSPHTCYMPRPSHSQLDHPNNIGEQYRTLSSSLLGPNIFLSSIIC